MKITVDIISDRDLADAITSQVEIAKQAARPALIEQVEKIRAASMEIVPIDQGILRASALAVGTNLEEDDTGVDALIGYGGAASSYALIQHETPPDVFTHLPGRTWKYLERPTLEAAGEIRDALTAALTAAFTHQGGTGPADGPTFGDE